MITAACFVIVVAGLKAASSIIIPCLLAVFIVVIATPFFIWLRRRGIPTALAFVIMILVVLVAGGGVTLVVGESLGSLTKDLPAYQERFSQYIENVLSWLEARGIDAPDRVIYDVLNPKNAVNLVGSLLSGFSGLMSQAALILLIVIFILLEIAILPQKVRELPGLTENTWERLNRIVDDVRQYMGIKTMMSLLTGVLVAVFLAAMGVSYPIMLGLLSFLLNYIPTIGSFLAAVPGVLLALIQFGLTRALIVAVGYLVINVLVSNGIEPRFMGKKLGLSPMIIIVAMVFWGWVLGPVGMLLSVPLTMTVKVAMESGRETQWLAVLMGGATAGKSDDVKEP
jgi:predicted PurR-regulated permease PerM